MVVPAYSSTTEEAETGNKIVIEGGDIKEITEVRCTSWNLYNRSGIIF